jgi:hypothetical protein
MRMKLTGFVAVVAAMVAVAAAAAQSRPSTVTWQKVLFGPQGRGEIKSMAVAANGDILVAGFAPGASGRSDAWVARYDPSGCQIWSRLIGDEWRDEAARVTPTPDGGTAVVGWRDIDSSGRFSSNGLAVKLGADGAVLWSRALVEAQHLVLSELEVLEKGDVIAGSYERIDAVMQHPYVARLEAAPGSVEWTFDPDPHAARTTRVRMALACARLILS